MIESEAKTHQKTPWPKTDERTIAEGYGPGERIKVKCSTPQGLYYDFLRRREGDVFCLVPKYITETDKKTGKVIMENGVPKKRLLSALDQFSETTMELVEDAEPERVTTAQQALNKQTAKLAGKQ